jgi:hypothetical protein
MVNKPRNVPNAADTDKDEKDAINPMGHPERTVKKPGQPDKKVLNELDPECQDIQAPIKLQEFAMATSRISEEVQDAKGVKGDFMTKMGGKTDKLGGKQKNTGGFDEFGDSKSGEATDGITTQIKDMNLKTKQKNTGGTFETMNIAAGMASDGITTPIGTMGSELGQNSMQKNKGGQFETVKGSQNRMAEEWSLNNIASIMEGDNVNLLGLFESYSADSSYVCLEDFQQLCQAHGVQTMLSEQHLQNLMATSRKFMFYEGNDATGKFWQPRPIVEMVSSGAVADVPVSEDDEIPPEIEGDGIPSEIDGEEIEGGEEIETPEGDIGAEIIDVEGGTPDDLADVFQAIGDDFERAANLIAGHNEQLETPEDEAAEGDIDIGPEGEGAPEEEDECVECTEEVPGEEVTSPESGNLMQKIASGVKGNATAVAMKGRGKDISTGAADEKEKEADEKNAEAPSQKIARSESRCARCGTILDENGCMLCDLLRESKGWGNVDAEGASADSHGHFTSDKTKKGQGELGTKVPPQETCKSTSGAASDGITTEVPGKQTPLKPKMKNTGGQAAFGGGGGTMKENIMRLSRVAKEAINHGAKKIGRAGKYTIRFGVKTEDASGIYTSLTDALTVVEELLQVMNGKNIVLEALYSIPHQKTIIHRHRLPLAETKKRDPIFCEGKILFKTGMVANAFADRVVAEGIACRVKNHNWGAAVVGPFAWPIAKRAFQTISEAWGSQIHTPEREAFYRGYDFDNAGNVEGEFEGDTIDDDEPEYEQAHNPEAPGFFDPEGRMCPNCGSSEAPDEHGICYGCGQRRTAAPGVEFGAAPEEEIDIDVGPGRRLRRQGF